MTILGRKTTLVTGAAGFIGSFVCQRLLQQNQYVIGIDNLNDSYDVQLKQDRLARLVSPKFTFIKQDIANQSAISSLFNQFSVDKVVHLAAEAGQGNGDGQTERFISSNVVGFNNIIAHCRVHQIKHLLYASTAAVYGDNADFPVTEQSNSDQPLSLYAATKKANEVMAHSYASMYALPVTGLRFFTVYGPWGRPDMALYKFADRIMAGLGLNIHNNGNHTRDLIYIDDLVDAILAALEKPPSADHQVPHKIYNIGNQTAIGLLEMVESLEQQLDRKTTHKLLPRQVGEIKDNQADTTLFFQQFGFKPQVDFKQGLKKFVAWYRQYHSV